MTTYIHPSQVKKLKSLGVDTIEPNFYSESETDTANGVTFEMCTSESKNKGFWLWVDGGECEPDFMIIPCIKGGFVVNGVHNNFSILAERGAVYGSLTECVKEVFNVMIEAKEKK